MRCAPAILCLALAPSLLGCPADRVRPRPSAEPPSETWDLSERDAVRLELVAALLEGGRYQEALDTIAPLRAEGLAPDALDLLQARALMGLELYGEAIALLESDAIRRADSDRWATLGLARFGARDFDGAAEALEEAIQRAERDAPAAIPELYNNLGFALDTAGRPADAVEAYQRALSLDPSLSRARNNLGFALAALGRDDEALASFRAAGVADGAPRSEARVEADAWYNLGLARQLRGDLALALAAFDEALTFDSDHARAQAARAELPEQETP